MSSKIARVLLWVGVATTLGLGVAYPNPYDMLFLMGGVLLMTLGLVMTLVTMRRTH